MEILVISASVIFLVIIIIAIVIKSSSENEFDDKKECVQKGMSVEKLLNCFGEPNKKIIIDDKTSLYVYTCDKWKGLLFGGSKHEEIVLTISDGIVKSISKE